LARASLAFVWQERGKRGRSMSRDACCWTRTLAFANTLVLLTGGWFMACGLGGPCGREKNTCARRWTLAALLAGVLFLAAEARRIPPEGRARHPVRRGHVLHALLPAHGLPLRACARRRGACWGCLARSVRLGHSHAGDHQNFEAGACLLAHVRSHLAAALSRSSTCYDTALRHTRSGYFLITLTTASWLLAERHARPPALLLGLAAVKFTLVAGWFMELRRTHRFWQVALGGLLMIIITGVVWLA
jgi:hypothetical protein